MIEMTCDYYYCKKCEWHRSDSNIGMEHIQHFDYEESNKKDAKYYYDLVNKKWHRPDRNYIEHQAELILSKGKILKKRKKEVEK